MTRTGFGHLFRAALVAAATIALSSSARAQERDTPPDDGALGTHQRHVRFDLGWRSQFVSSAGLDPFSERDHVPHLALGASYALWARDRLSLAGALGFDYGARSANARSSDAELSLLRFTLAPEARYHVLRILALTAKVGPTLTRQEAVLSTGLATDLKDVSWKMGFDATAGVALEVFGYSSGESRKPRIWVTAEGGYGFSARSEQVLKPVKSGLAPERTTPVTLPDLSLSGPLFKAGAALSF